jgi:hypothetical protein
MTNGQWGMRSQLSLLVALTSLSAASCSSSPTPATHDVYFVGYVYDGATGQRLAAKDVMSVSIKYRDQVIHTNIEDDGRFVSTDPLPTWQDYTVAVTATGYRPFESDNAGIDVPKSLQMTDGVATLGTQQTFHFDVRLFPTSLMAPAVTVTIQKSDALVAVPPPGPASGTLRLQPVSSSVLEAGDPSAVPVWPNDDDLLNQTVTLPFTGGTATIAAGTLVYGVTYAMTIFDVDGYQPFTGQGSQAVLTAGSLTSLAVTIQVDTKAPLRILQTDAGKCVPPLPTDTKPGGDVDITFSEDIEASDATLAEAIDDGVSISVSNPTSLYCPLSVSTDPTKQERGTSATITGNMLTLAFNPSVGLATMTTFGTTCTPPPAFAAIVYGNLANVFVQPKGDPVRKRSLTAMLAELPASTTFPGATSSSLSCPAQPSLSSF